MAKESKKESKKEVAAAEEKVTAQAIKGEKKSKENRKKAQKTERLAVQNEKRKVEEKIDALMVQKKSTKDKAKKKELNKEIKELKHQRSRIGKKDTFISDVLAEMRLVRWPKKSEMFKYSIACLVFVIFFALFFFGMDALFALVKDLID